MNDTYDALQARVAALEERNTTLEAEKRHYQWLAESTTDLISRHARDGTFLYASNAARELLGYAPSELIGVSAYQLFHPADLSDLLNKSSQVYYHNGFYQQTYRFRAKSGRYVWFETTSRTRRDPATGELIDILCVSRDVGRRVRAEAHRERLAQVVESTSDYVLFVGADQHIFSANEAARRQFSLPRKNPHAPLANVYTAASLELLEKVVMPAVARYGSWSGELEMHGRKEPLPVLSVVQAHRGRGAEAGHLSLLNHDIRLRKAAEAQARRHQAQIAHANRLATMGELTSNIAHELNQPLGAMANYASGALLQLRAKPDQPAHHLAHPIKQIDLQIQRLAKRLRHIRTFVRKGSTQCRPVKLSDVLEAAWSLCQWQYQQAQMQFIPVLPTRPVRVQADPVALEQVIVNLLLNALEASRHQHDASIVQLSAEERERNQVALHIDDQGPGVPEAQQTHIFTAFHSTRTEGLGMGLAISRSLMEAMGGQLSVSKSPLFNGARFTATLRSASFKAPATLHGRTL
ncbi:PAS domain S-box protein [Halomonas vilamensis]|uniref:histidine kinase n=1 Tax=Vreelandella vilamensis TaxID=531309 RepID=A0ABU1H2F7_9GAMM|nr:ATP-binding protein [Halomonas vilamensis]MDR5897947.1 PAS domain S-box protein [Halomonas vilamensis]